MRYEITLTGASPLIMHQDNLAWSERVRAWTKDPKHKGQSVAGDDRSPAWTWLGYAYCDDITGLLHIPSDNLMTVLRDGGKKMPAATGRGSLKVQACAGLAVDAAGWPLEIADVRVLNPDADVPTVERTNWRRIKFAPLAAKLADETDFAAHCEAAEKAGFRLFCKRAKIGSSKHVRVRPIFDAWRCSGTITVTDTALTVAIVQQLLDTAGKLVGLCDWRPGSPQASGRYGTFSATVTRIG